MKKEHAVSVSLTNGTECICNPDIILGDKHGLWDLDNEISPIGTLFDLNAAWELFISRKKFENISYRITENSKGDKTYTLVDDNGNPTEAVFTIKNIDDQQIVSIQWQDGYLYIFYNRKRVITPEEESGTIPVEYVLDEQGHHVYDEETGKPLVYDNVKIPAIEIFDNHETHTLFPWFADDQHTVRLRQTLDDDTNHLGDFAITTDSEVFFAKTRFVPNTGNTLISLQSVYDHLLSDLGFGHTYTTDNTIIDSEGQSIHQRVTGNTLSTALITETKTSIIGAINTIEATNNIAELLAFGYYNKQGRSVGDVTSSTSSDYVNNALSTDIPNIPNGITYTRKSLLGAINILQSEIGDPTVLPTAYSFGTSNIVSNIVDLSSRITTDRDRIGWNLQADPQTWKTLNTDANTNLTDAVNEVDSHINGLTTIVGVSEGNPFTNPYIHQTIKTRLNKTNNIKIVEAINDIQTQIGDLTSLTTSEKLSLIGAINELKSNIGVINNLTTDVKTSLVGAINELDTHIDSNTQNIGDLTQLNTTDKSDLVSSINEVLSGSPFIYESTGIKSKNENNIAGAHSFIVGTGNTDYGTYDFIFGSSNSINYGSNNFVSGVHNTLSLDDFTTIFGESNTVNDSTGILVGGYHNTITKTGSGLVVGNSNTISNSSVLQQVFILGNSNSITRASDNYIIGKSNSSSAADTFILGYSNDLSNAKTHNTVIGNSNIIINSGTNDHNTIVDSNLTLIGINNLILNNYRGTNKTYNVNNATIIGNPLTPVSGKVNIGGDIIIEQMTKNVSLNGNIIFNLPVWYAATYDSIITDAQVLPTIQALSNAALENSIFNIRYGYGIRYKGLGDEVSIYKNGVEYYYNMDTNKPSEEEEENVTWYRNKGLHLKVISQSETIGGETVNKNYLAFKDVIATQNIVDYTGPQYIENVDYTQMPITHAYGAIDLDDIWNAFDLTTKLNNKVNTSSVLTTVKDVNGTPTNITQPISSVTLDLINSFGFDKSLYQLRSEKGQANGYAPLDANGKVPATNLPSYVDDVIDVWAEYDISTTGELSNIHLYEYNSGTKGSEILSGESDKVYVQANGTIARQFRWSGSVWSPIGPAQLVLGEVQGTAYDGLKGKTTTDNVNSHIANTNNPHNVQASQLNVTINDPNDPNNLLGTSPYNVNYNVLTALQKLFDRVNISEDDLSSLTTLIGSVSEIEQLAGTSVIGAILDFTPMTNSEITTSVNTYFKFYGEN